MSDGTTRVPLLDHPLRAPSAFTPEALLEAVRLERSLASERVPDVCILEFDGDLTDWLAATGRVRRWPSWACFHTAMNVVDVDGGRVGVIARTAHQRNVEVGVLLRNRHFTGQLLQQFEGLIQTKQVRRLPGF